MTWSPLMSRSVHTNKFSGRQGNTIERLIPHHTAGGSNQFALNFLANSAKKVSATYVLLTTGELVGLVPEEFRPWTTGWTADKSAITVETVNSSGAPDWRVTDAQIDMLIMLAADLAERYGWEELNRSQRLRGHRQYAATACPGPYLWGKFDEIVERANYILAPPPKPIVIPKYEGAQDMFYPIHPDRFADTRDTNPLVAHKDTEFGLDPAIVPIDAVAVTMNITAINTHDKDWAHLTVWGSGSKPLASVLNFNPDQTIANGSYTGPVSELKFFMNASAPMDIIFDVTGYWTP